jgi:transporter family protein
VDKLSILVSVLFSRVVFHEKLPKRAIIGLVLLTAGTVIMAVNWNLPALNQ